MPQNDLDAQIKRQKLYLAIQDNIEQSSLWPNISQGKIAGKCIDFSKLLYQELSHKIDGLSLAVVENTWPLQVHGWLVAHHPDAGYFMIEPTISQFAQNASSAPYKGVFIGSYGELEKLFSSGAYQAYDYAGIPTDMHLIWSPATHLYEDAKSLEYYSSAPEEHWAQHPSCIGRPDDVGMPLAETLGKWAARMEAAGQDWKNILFTYVPKHGWSMAKEVCEENMDKILAAKNLFTPIISQVKMAQSRQQASPEAALTLR